MTSTVEMVLKNPKTGHFATFDRRLRFPSMAIALLYKETCTPSKDPPGLQSDFMPYGSEKEINEHQLKIGFNALLDETSEVFPNKEDNFTFAFQCLVCLKTFRNFKEACLCGSEYIAHQWAQMVGYPSHVKVIVKKYVKKEWEDLPLLADDHEHDEPQSKIFEVMIQHQSYILGSPDTDHPVMELFGQRPNLWSTGWAFYNVRRDNWIENVKPYLLDNGYDYTYGSDKEEEYEEEEE